ncbi:MAG TPA: malto-oligosyltrehalose trehalohydrolase [Anaeromyxobacter sp.]|nr:malto-oligosyltrehalose trehalohydrolase [Anaeromyxobacter sp.]
MPARRFSAGAEVSAAGVHFRVWAPRSAQVEVLPEGAHPARLAPEPGGFFSALVPGLRAGVRYTYRLDGGAPLPDPASRFQPEGPQGPSLVVDPGSFRWADAGWRGLRPQGQVLYELHLGTFTLDGTWEAAAHELEFLADLGITALEVMPVADSPGRFGWGYDGVCLYAPNRLYGTPDDMRRFVDRAHTLGLGVLLDVVYNHLGPAGASLTAYTPDYLNTRYRGEWGAPLNFDGPESAAVRDFVADNAAHWIAEYHLDGLRLDATQGMFDSSARHIVREVTERARAAAADRRILLVAENEPEDARLVRPVADGGEGLDMLWNDDLHHSAAVALTGRREAYYQDHQGSAQELVSAAKHGFLFQGQYYSWQKKRRGQPTRGLPGHAFVAYLENHDQVANSARGERLWQRTGPGRFRAGTALLLLGPWTPMLFMGEEHGSSRPFCYFADHAGELGRSVRRGRAEFLRQFQGLAGADMRDGLPDPTAPATFEACRLDPSERALHPQVLALHRDLLRLRRQDPVIATQGAAGLDGAVLAPEALCLRFFEPGGRDRLLLVNLGADLSLAGAAEPLLAPPDRQGWRVLWSSEDPRYGGTGTPEVEEGRGLRLAGHAALLLGPAEPGMGASSPGKEAPRG